MAPAAASALDAPLSLGDEFPIPKCGQSTFQITEALQRPVHSSSLRQAQRLQVRCDRMIAMGTA